MDKKLNPLDGEIDLLGDTVSDIIRKLNPITGRLELVYSANNYIQKINPFIGDFDMVGSTGASYIVKEVTGNGYINLTNAVANHLMELKVYGGTEQNGTPTPTTPVDIVCNNGAIKFSKNMANVNEQTALIGYYISAQGQVLESPYNRIYQEFIPCKPNTKYTVSMSPSVYYISISEYSTAEDSGFVRRSAGSTGGNTQLTITTRSNTNYLRFGANLSSSDITIDDILAINRQLEEGNTPTPYKPYAEGGLYVEGTTETISSTLSTATAEMLLKVDDYADEQGILSGNITRKVGVLVLDGVTDGRKLTATWNTTYKRGNITVPTIKQTSYLIADCVCTHFPYNTSTQGAPTSPGFCSREQDKLILFTFAGMDNINSSNDANAFLADQYNAGTPVIIVYPLETPTTESVARQTMNIPAGNSTISITQASIENLGLYAKYKATE